MEGKWAYQALQSDGRCYGMDREAIRRLHREAALIINLHGGTVPLPEHAATGRLVYLETDPVLLQIELHDGVQGTIDFLSQHCAFFTFGENWGRPDCLLPTTDRFRFKPTRQPVVTDLWRLPSPGPNDTFTTVGNWRQINRPVHYRGEAYSWSKHEQFLKFLDLPARTGQAFELALSTKNFGPDDRRVLEENGWRVRDSLGFSYDADPYRDYSPRLPRRVHGRQGPEHPPAERVVQRPQRDVPRRRTTGGYPGDGVQQPPPDRPWAVRVLDDRWGCRRSSRGSMPTTPRIAVPPRRSPASTSTTTWS
jgi:hypothetical protein